MKSELYLKNPSLDDKEEWLNYVKEYKEDNKDATPGGFLDNMKYEDWLNRINNESNSILEDGRVPASFYFLMDDERIIGSVSIRHNLNNEFLKKYGGHIGYNIRPSERGKGFGTKMLYMALFKCDELGLDDVMVTCKKDNLASCKVIENNGGVLFDEVFIPEEDAIFKIYWINVFESLLNEKIGKKM